MDGPSTSRMQRVALPQGRQGALGRGDGHVGRDPQLDRHRPAPYCRWTIRRMALVRARGTCLESGCSEFPVFGGRCKRHARWPTVNPDRPSGWEMSRLKAMLIAERGRRCEYPGCNATAPLEIHHLNGVEDNRPKALALRCRKHNPRGAPTHKR
jgi:hypothetical protein